MSMLTNSSVAKTVEGFRCDFMEQNAMVFGYATFLISEVSELLGYCMKIQWKQFTLQNSIIADVRNRQLVVECYSQDDRGKRVLVGEFITDLTQLQASTTAQNVFFVSFLVTQSHVLLLRSHELTTTSSKIGRKTSGTIEVVKCNEMAVYSFLDYIVNGSVSRFILFKFAVFENDTTL
uniref:Uncharacterized protein n=1 Tax=Parascaris equorum TaxID=6256 RepID=A0A914R4G0_PAREQ